ncbi:MAG TPA: hypothetical protein VFQ78_12245 [Candidatus Udaeobacter sp.]|jgi:hypothetical protein|nr:hypothetical protein [Candidatus Udaeobacter sp.]
MNAMLPSGAALFAKGEAFFALCLATLRPVPEISATQALLINDLLDGRRQNRPSVFLNIGRLCIGMCRTITITAGIPAENL